MILEQCAFFSSILEVLDEYNLDSSSQLRIGGDFNVHLNAVLDNTGGKKEKKDSVETVEELKFSYDLIDIWRIRNNDKRQYTWRQRKPYVQRRLDYWLVCDCLEDVVEHTDIIPSIKSDHSAITLQVKSIENHALHLYFNSSLLSSENYLELINQTLPHPCLAKCYQSKDLKHKCVYCK